MILDFQLVILTTIIIICFSPTSSYEEQNFVVEPENQTVIFGSKIVLPCKVKNKSGILQWTLNDFGLGDKRNLPGYDRYKMIGNDEDGNYSLEIFPVTLEDEGKYQCQVSARFLGQQPLRSKFAWLTVIIPSESPIILPELEDGILNVFEGEEFTLNCVSIGGRPSAEIVWIDNYNRTVTENIIYKKKIFINSDEFTATSTIRKIAKRKDNNAVFTCQAQNGAMEPYPTTQVRINVLYPSKITVKAELNSEFLGKTVRSVDGIVIHQIQPSFLEEHKWYLGTQLNFYEDKENLILNSSTNLQYAYANCSVTLETEETKDILKLNKSDGPDFFWKIYNVNSNTENNATLTCEAEGNPLPEISWIDGNTNRVVSQLNTISVNYNAVSTYYCMILTKKIKKKMKNQTSKITIVKKNFPETTNHHFKSSESVAKVECLIQSVPLLKQNFLIFYDVYPNGTNQKYSTREEQVSGDTKKALWSRHSKSTDPNYDYHSMTHLQEINFILIWFKSNKQFLIFVIIMGIALFLFTMVMIIYTSYLSHKSKTSSLSRNRDNKVCIKDGATKSSDCKLELVIDADDHSDLDFLSLTGVKNGFVNEIDVNSVTPTRVETFRMPPRQNFEFEEKLKIPREHSNECSLPKNMVNINENYVSYVGYSKNYNPPETKGEQKAVSHFNQPFSFRSLTKPSKCDSRYDSLYGLENRSNTYMNALNCLSPENLKSTLGDPPRLPCSTVWQDQRVSYKDDLYKYFKGSLSSIPEKMTLL